MFLIIDVILNGMAVRGSRDRRTDPASLPAIVPFDIPHLSRLNWELGSRVIEGASLVGDWRHTGRRWGLSVFDVTENTVVIRIRTSVGRERFYSAIRSELQSALPELDSSAAWRRVE